MTAYRKKLIEVALPLEDINREAAREKSIRHGHPSTLHLWWARRPLAACRAVLFASLVDDPEAEDVDPKFAAACEQLNYTSHGTSPRERLFSFIAELVKWENSNKETILNTAHELIQICTGGNPPPVYDPFCGGGSIPLEAQRLGLEAHASDLNPVAVLITKALIEIPPKFAGKPPLNPESRRKLGASGSWKGAAGLAEDIRYYGQWMRDEAERRIGHLYPKVRLPKEYGGGEATVIAWLWARTVASPNPAAKGAHVPLVRSFWLSTKAGKKACVEPVVDLSTMTYRFEIRTGNGEPRAGTVNRNGGLCLLTGSPMPLDHIRNEGVAGRMGARLMAIVAEAGGRRVYLPPTEEQQESARKANAAYVSFLEVELSTHPQYMATPRYGMTKPRHLFSGRQLATLTVLCDLIAEARTRVLHDSCDESYANAIATYLAFTLSKTTTRNCTLAIWERGMDRLAGALGRQAIQMQWDYAETNPFAGAGGDFSGTVESLSKVLEKLVPAKEGRVRQQDARKLVGSPKTVFSTDPPYYDNVPYADLSDFFYVWLRRGLGGIYPELLATLLAPKASELVADQLRHGGRGSAQAFFEKGLQEVFGRIRENSSPDYPFTVYYAFKQQETESDDDDVEQNTTASTGWETMLEGLVSSGFSVVGTWPMRTEQPKGLRESGRNALASSIVLVCRPRPKDAGVASRRDFLAALRQELPEALRNLQKGNIAPVDLAQAAIGPGMAVFSRYARVLENDGSPMSVRTALALINQTLDEVLAEQEGEFDADTRWALAWFDQYGFTEGAYGVAETLSTAKNTSVSGMVEAGILAAKGGKVRLLKKEELDTAWDPAVDKRLTIWEAAHYLIRALESEGESAAAALMKKLAARAEVARDLAYRLYTICERRKRSQDALAYNSLVLNWPEITNIAQSIRETAHVQGELI